MISPVRVRLSRKKGWRMPPNTVKVDRSTRWGNPYVAGNDQERAEMARRFAEHCRQPRQAAFVAAVRAELRGLNLACWCPLNGPCHADVLLEIANAAEAG